MLAQNSFDWRGPPEETFGLVTDFVHPTPLPAPPPASATQPGR